MIEFVTYLFFASLFAVFVVIVCAPVALLVWVSRRWYVSHNLRRLPWRRRRAALGVALLWQAAFYRLSVWKKFAGFSVILSVLFVAFLFVLRATIDTRTVEDSIAQDLRSARYGWLQDGCPQPPDQEKYLGYSSSWTGFVYTASIVVKDPDQESRSQGLIKERTCRGLFAIKDLSSSCTYVIATTGEIIALEKPGQVRLLRQK